MQVKLSDLWNGWQALGKLGNADLPAKKAYALSRFLKRAADEYDLLDKQRVKLIEKYGDKDAAGNVSVSPDNIGAFTTEFNEVLAGAVELPDLALTVDDLDGAKLSAIQFFTLAWLFDKDEPAEQATAANG